MRRPALLHAVCRAGVVVLAGLCALPTRADVDAAEYIVGPEVEQGELAVESKAGVAWNRDGRSRWGVKLGVEYGITTWWSSELTVGVGREGGASAGLRSVEWENRILLVESDAHPHVIGALIEIERHRGLEPDDDGGGASLRYGPLLQSAWGPVQLNLNLLFERRLGTGGERTPTEFGYQWQWRWRRDAALDWGLQGFGALGPWNDWAPRAEQSHVLGPTLFGRMGLGDSGAWDREAPEFEVGLLFGLGGEAPPVTLRLQASLPF